MAVKIAIEPIFEADFQDNSYGFRPKRNAHQAVENVNNHLLKGKTDVEHSATTPALYSTDFRGECTRESSVSDT